MKSSFATLALVTVFRSANAACSDLTSVATLNLAAGTSSACTINGGTTISALGATASCGVQCATGYNVTSGSPQGTVTCTQNAHDNSLAMTVSITCAANVCQGNPTDGQTGFDYSTCSDNAGTDVTGATCTPTCLPGYAPGAGAAGTATGFTMSCSSSGAYSIGGNDGSLTCTPRQCQNAPTSGAQTGFDYTSCSDAATDVTGTTCTPVCATGYSAGSGAAATATGFTLDCRSGGAYTASTDATLTCTPNACTGTPASAVAGVDYSSCNSGSVTGQTCTPVCLSTHTNGGTTHAGFVLSCAANGAWTAQAGALTCAENSCTAASGNRQGYKCTGATTNTACLDGVANTATKVSDLGTLTCAANYGTGPLALAAGNGPKVTCTHNGNFVFSGCHDKRCDRATGLGSNPFPEDNPTPPGPHCSVAGTKIKTNLAIFCESSTGCASTDCCTNINECTEYDDPGTPANVDAQGGAAVLLSGCAANSFCTDADPTNSSNNGIQGTTLQLHGDTAGTVTSTHTCTCNPGYFGDGDTSGTGCTQCTAVANSVSVTCTSATNSRAVCVTGAILVPAASTSTADVCRLECPFVDLMAMVDVLQPSATSLCPTLAAAADVEQSKTSCEAVKGCYYKPATTAPAVAHSCAELYTDCRTLSASAAACTTNGPRIWGSTLTVAADDGTADTDTSGDGTIGTLTKSGCHYTAASAGGDTWDDNARCDIAPASIVAGATTYATVRTPIVRCEALLATGWAHDLRGSCDASLACRLHDHNTVVGLVGQIKRVYANPAASPPDLNGQSNDNGAPSNNVGGFFTTDAANDKTTYEICSDIRDAVNAAPTCSSGSG